MKQKADWRLLSQGGNLSIPDLEKFAKEKSNDPVALMRLGAAYAKAGTADKAAQAYEKALQANPKLLEAALALAQLNAGPLKNNAKALEYAKKARELAPTDAHVTATLRVILRIRREIFRGPTAFCRKAAAACPMIWQ